jgi:hypothetical protein
MVTFLKAMLKTINGILFGGAIGRLLKNMPKYPSAILLIVVNLVPLYGVLYQGWQQGYILMLYWGETLIVGFYNVFRMLLVQNVDTSKIEINGEIPVFNTKTLISSYKIQLISFFIMHFGFFCLIHGIFLIQIAKIDIKRFLHENTVNASINSVILLLIPIIGLFISHGFSFVSNYIVRKEYKRQTLNVLMFKPYTRIVVTHFTILFGALVSSKLSSQLGPLVLMIILKTFLDLLSHIFAHKNLKHPEIAIK